MLKKILLIILSSFFLFSCSSKDDLNDGLESHSQTGFTIRIPKKWELLKNDTSILPKPSSGKLELVTTSKSSKKDFFNSFVILSEDLEKNIASSDYSSLNNLAQKDDYYLYNEVATYKDFSFGDKNKKEFSKLYIFDVKYNSDMKKLRFLQTGIVCGKKGYILTLAIPTSIKNDDLLKYKYIFSTFKCKK